MKFFNIPTSITLAASLFWTFSNATIKIENLPSDVHVGATYPIAWSNDRDYVSHNTQPDQYIRSTRLTLTSKSKTSPSSAGRIACDGPLASRQSITT